MFSSKSFLTNNSTSSFIKNRKKPNKNNIKKSKLKSIMSFDNCFKLGKLAKNMFKSKTISKKIIEKENRSITNLSLLDNKNQRISNTTIPIENNCNYDLLMLNSSCNCENNFKLYKCDHEFKPFFNSNKNESFQDYELIDSFTEHTRDVILNSSTLSNESYISSNCRDSEAEEKNCCRCCKSSTQSQELLESEYLEFINTFCNKINTEKHSLNESMPSLPVSNSTSFLSSYSSESSIDILLSRMDINNVSCNGKKNCSCFNQSKKKENQHFGENSDFEEVDIEINHCIMIIKDISKIKMNQDDDNLLTKIYACITDYEPIFDDDLPVSFAECVTVLKNNNETDDWLNVRSIKTGQQGYIPRYIAMDLNLFLQQVKSHCNKLISSKRKFTI
jgi:hypothetical protein